MCKPAQTLMMAAIAAALSTGSASAQRESRIENAGNTLELVIAVVSQSVFASLECTAGDRAPWFFVISAIDRRYAYCVKQDPRWAAFAQGWEREQEESKATRLKEPGIGSFAYIRAMNELPTKVQPLGAFCSGAPWKVLLNPDAANVEERDSFTRTHPGVNIEESLKVIRAVLSLGGDKSWIEAPCDSSFWPAAFTTMRR